MTLRNLLVLAAGVFGPALLAHEMARLLGRAAVARRAGERRPDAVDELLSRAFPDGLPAF